MKTQGITTKVTMEEGANEGAARAIPYYYILEAME